LTSMKSNRPTTNLNKYSRTCLVSICLFLGYGQLPAQEVPPPIFQPSEEEIAQGHNKGVTTWEGTLFGQDSYKPGSYAQIEVVPNPGFEFERWEGANIGDTAEAKTFVTMSDHIKIKPHYKRIWNVIAAPDNKEAGKVKGGGNYPEGTEVKLSVEPNEGFKFLGWEGKGIIEEEKEELETSIIVEGDHDIVARFENENQDENSGGGGGGGGDSDENQDENEDQNEDQDQQDQEDQSDQQENEDQQDQEDQNEDQQDQAEDEQDQGDQEEQPQEPESGEEDPAEPEEGDEEEQDEGDQGSEEEQPQAPEGEEEAPAQEAPAGGDPVPLQMTPEEATRLLDAMEDGEKKLPLFLVTPPDQKKDSKKDW